MSKIQIQNAMVPDAVTLPGAFIKHYMAKASGEFVKIFLYLYYMVTVCNEAELSEAADALLCTESDILRALKYWENQGIVMLQRSSDGALQKLTFLNIQETSLAGTQTAASSYTNHTFVAEPAFSYPGTSAETSSYGTAAGSLPEAGAKAASAGSLESSAPKTSALNASAPEDTVSTLDALVRSSRSEQEAVTTSPEISSINLEYDDNFQELCFLAQTYTKKTLSSRDTQRLGYWYQLYNGSYQIIEYLLEYCVELGHANFNYMEKVLLNWHEKGYTTVAEIKEHGKAHNVITYRVMSAFGLKDRNPGAREAEFIQKWYQTYGFSIDMIELACQKTLSAIQKPSFEYTDSILSAWHKKELTTPEQVAAFEQKRKQKEAASAPTRPVQSRVPKKAAGNKFHNFEQHDTDYSQLLSDYYGVKLP